jgi:sulfotransferase family protein
MTPPVIMMWAHSRSASTAFLRMMIERGDVTVVHEPFLALTEEGTVTLPTGRTARSAKELLALLAELGGERPVFVKEVLDYEYYYLLDHPEELAPFTHTFMIRDPRQTIASHYAAKPTVTSPEIGYERLWALYSLLAAGERAPLVLRAERLLSDPEGAVRAFCAYTGLPYLPEALHWEAGDRPEWRRHRAWHLDAIGSAGFHDRRNAYADTVANNPVLRSFYDHHLPFYERLLQHAD